MTFQSPGAILFTIGPLTIRWYGLLIALGFLVATSVVMKLSKRWNLDQEKIINAALIGFVSGVLGGRLYFVALSWPYFISHPAEILATWKGGLSIHGGIIGGFLATAIYCYYAKLPVLRCLDMGGCATVLAQAVGRWGNFFNSEAFGRPVGEDFPLKLFIPLENRPLPYFHHSYFHPTFLYESLWNVLTFLFLYYVVLPRMEKYPGATFCIYVALYNVGRLLIEPIRVDSIMAMGVPVPIVASAAGLALSLIAAMALISYHKRKATGKEETSET